MMYVRIIWPCLALIWAGIVVQGPFAQGGWLEDSDLEDFHQLAWSDVGTPFADKEQHDKYPDFDFPFSAFEHDNIFGDADGSISGQKHEGAKIDETPTVEADQWQITDTLGEVGNTDFFTSPPLQSKTSEESVLDKVPTAEEVEPHATLGKRKRPENFVTPETSDDDQDNSLQTQLLHAIELNDFGLTAQLLDQIAVNKLPVNVDSLIGLALKAPDRDIMELLIAAGADANAVSPYNGRPLIFDAIDHGDLMYLETLLQSGAQVNVQESLGLTPLQAAVIAEDANIIKLLASFGATSTWKGSTSTEGPPSMLPSHPLYFPPVVPVGVEVYPGVVHAGNRMPTTREYSYISRINLLSAVAANDLESARVLLAQLYGEQIPVEVRPLLLAAMRAPDREMVKLLVEYGGLPNTYTMRFANVLLLDAATRGDVEYLSYLILRGLPVPSLYGEIALDVARTFGHKEIIKMLEQALSE